MKLRPRLLLTALAVSIPVAILLYLLVDSYREAERRALLERMVTAQMTDDLRDRCESNANWFLAGPRENRPSAEQLSAPDADVTAPRPRPQELPFDYFAYNDAFEPASVAGPRLPADLKLKLRGGAKKIMAPFDTREGRGWQLAIATGWEKGPCPILLYRMRALPGQRAERLWSVLALFAGFATVSFVSAAPAIWRIRRLGLEARESASKEYTTTVDIGGRDELSALAFAFNEAGADIRRRSADVKDRAAPGRGRQARALSGDAHRIAAIGR
jgi:HAMP domain